MSASIGLQRIAFLGNYVPRMCGIATFTHDLHRSISCSLPEADCYVGAVTDKADSYNYPDEVRFQIQEKDLTQDLIWLTESKRAFEWFLGRNDLGLPLYDFASGACSDGLHRDRINENQGAESTLAFHLSLSEMVDAEFGVIKSNSTGAATSTT